MPKQIPFILIVLIFCSCNSTKRDSITQLDKDFLIIKESQLELVKHYEKCLSVFSHKSDVADGYERIFCNLSSGQTKELEKLNLIKTKQLIDMGYKVNLDAKNHYRIFYQLDKKEYIAGVIKYGLLYSNITHIQDSIYSLNFNKIDTLKRIDSFNSVIELNEYAE